MGAGPVRAAWRSGADDGASAVEFALILPVFVMMVFGMIGGGIILEKKLSIAHAAREASRYAATLPTSQPGPDIDAYLHQVAGVARSSAEGDLDSGSPQICVAYLDGSGGSRRYVGDGVGAGTMSNAPCYTDGRPPSEIRIQVEAYRDVDWALLLLPTWHVTIGSDSVSRYEVIAAPTATPTSTP